VNLEGKWKAIFIGGLITGLAPFVPLLNLACCIIPLIGAIVAVAVYRSSDPPPALTNNEGIVLGAMSGLIGTGIYAVLVIPLVLFVGSLVGGIMGRLVPNLTEIPSTVRPLLEGLFSSFANIVGFILLIKIISQLAFSLIFGILGGLLGVALLKRSTSQP
jgi:uncharacterized membrane protein